MSSEHKILRDSSMDAGKAIGTLVTGTMIVIRGETISPSFFESVPLSKCLDKLQAAVT